MTENGGGDPASVQVAVLDGSCTLGREDIGGKAWGINRMRALGLPVPPAFVVTTRACQDHHADGRKLSDGLWAQIVAHLRLLEAGTGRRFGEGSRPLLVSVRSGAARSMPGMMDTVLNLGVNAEVQAALAAQQDARYAAETSQRFVDQYRKVVLRGEPDPIPTDPWAQLRAAVGAVFESWHSPRAQLYRHNRGLSDDGCTAVAVQAMVFGNLDEHSGTGVLFSRNPITGEAAPWGEWLARGQGEDVVSGRHTPLPLAALRGDMPQVHAELMHASAVLEADARDIQDIEFTVESGRLWLLQSRVAKRSPQAAVLAAVAFAEEGLISKEEAVRRLTPEQARQLPRLQLLAGAFDRRPLAVGVAACPGVATGVVVNEPQEAELRARRGEDIVLARSTTSPDDLQGIIAARGLMTEQGGSTSHAAVVSRELGRPCVVGCGSSTVTALAGQRVTLDGASGWVWAGDLVLEEAGEVASAAVGKLLEWGVHLIPIRLPAAGETAADAIDLDAFGDAWQAALRPGTTVRGRVLESDRGIRAAMVAGVRAAIVHHRLPALLACLQAVPDEAGQKNSRDAPATPGGRDVAELSLLRRVSLKGRVALDVLSDSLALPAETLEASYGALCKRGLCTEAAGMFRLTPAGRERVRRLLAETRAAVDCAAASELYAAFRPFNTELKQIMTAWQLRADGTPNDHLDAGYDAGVLERLAALHRRTGPLMQRLASLSPLLASYGTRLAGAAERIAAGDRSYVAKLVADSYHTVWFELHEDLLALNGLTRERSA